MNTRTTWNDYFTGSPNLIQKNEYETRQTPSYTNIHILNCLFRSITSTSDGGALYCSTSVTCLLVESSSFFSCKTSAQGGAIHFSNTGSGQFVLYEVCGNDCCTTGSTSGQFSLVNAQSSASSKNYINYSSIVRCVNENSNAQYMLYQQKGKFCCPSVNVSMNKCFSRSGVYCAPTGDSSSVICSLSYSTFTDNNATGHTCFSIWTAGGKGEFKSCNILRNTQVSGSEGTIYTSGFLTVENSCFLENIATYLFYSTSSSYTITLSKCTIDTASCNQNLIIQNTVTKSFILTLNHMSTQNCHAEYDSNGCPVHNIQIYCTYPKLLHQPQLSDVISLTSILIFNFIHPYSSNNARY
jgi:hypothetical protein